MTNAGRVGGVCFAVAGATLGVAVLAAACNGAPDAVQPIEFNHKVHIDGEVDCLQCHAGLLDPEDFPLPTLDTCVSCHNEPPPADKPELAKLEQFAKDKTPLIWDPLLRLPDHVHFSHLRHVDVAGLECLDCHSDMPARTSPPKYKRIMRMNHCISCHEKNDERPAARRATTDCASCHR